jgi:hypothetical protein
MIRAPLPDVVTGPYIGQGLSVGFVGIAVVSQEIPKGAEARLISFPDEIAVYMNGAWEFRPSPTVTPITDVLLFGLRYTGVTVESYRTLSAAKNAGVRVAIVGALTRYEVRIAEPRAEAIAELSVVLVDLGTFEILWRGILKVNDLHERIGYLPQSSSLKLKQRQLQGK